MGDIDAALAGLKVAVQSADSDPRVVALYVKLLMNHRSPSDVWSAIEPLDPTSSAVVAAARGYLQVQRGKFDEAEETLQAVIAAGDDLDSYSKALGLYALAEVNTHFLKGFTPEQTVDDLAEWVTLMELLLEEGCSIWTGGTMSVSSMPSMTRSLQSSEYTSADRYR